MLACAALAGCASGGPSTLPPLHVRGVFQLPLPAQVTAANSGQVTYIATYGASSGQSGDRVVVAYGTLISDVGLDGNMPRSLPVNLECLPPVAVAATSVGYEGACRGRFGLGVFSLADGTRDPGHYLLTNAEQLTGATILSDPTWSPGGKQLAAALILPGGAFLGIGIFTVVSHATGFVLSAVLKLVGSLPEHDSVDYYVGRLTWSPDGQYLAFLSGAAVLHIYVLDLASALSGAHTTRGAPAEIGVPVSTLTELPEVGNLSPPSWTPDSKSLIYVGTSGRTLMRVDVTTGYATTLFQEGVAGMCQSAASPDGLHVVFVLCSGTSTVDNLGPPEVVYVYDLPNSAAAPKPISN